MKKWNFEKQRYEGYDVPQNWRCGLYSVDSDELIDCVKCGKPMKYSDKYRSLEIHTEKGQEYAVCKKCFKEEWIKRQMHITRTKFVGLEENYMEIDDGER